MHPRGSNCYVYKNKTHYPQLHIPFAAKEDDADLRHYADYTSRHGKLLFLYHLQQTIGVQNAGIYARKR
ncbi:hypothetical protein D3C84_1240710 [compost metagenome]